MRKLIFKLLVVFAIVYFLGEWTGIKVTNATSSESNETQLVELEEAHNEFINEDTIPYISNEIKELSKVVSEEILNVNKNSISENENQGNKSKNRIYGIIGGLSNACVDTINCVIDNRDTYKDFVVDKYCLFKDYIENVISDNEESSNRKY